MIVSMIGADTPIVFNVGAGALLIGIIVFFLGLLAIVWKGKKEISDTIREELKPVNNTNNRLVIAVTQLQAAVRELNPGAILSSLLEVGASPLRPTQIGAGLIKDSGLENVMDEHKDELCIKLKAMLPTGYTEYDVQEKARALLISLKDDPMMNPVKDYVYANPMDIERILRVGGLWLRDDFLKKPRQAASLNDT